MTNSKLTNKYNGVSGVNGNRQVYKANASQGLIGPSSSFAMKKTSVAEIAPRK